MAAEVSAGLAKSVGALNGLQICDASATAQTSDATNHAIQKRTTGLALYTEDRKQELKSLGLPTRDLYFSSAGKEQVLTDFRALPPDESARYEMAVVAGCKPTRRSRGKQSLAILDADTSGSVPSQLVPFAASVPRDSNAWVAASPSCSTLVKSGNFSLGILPTNSISIDHTPLGEEGDIATVADARVAASRPLHLSRYEQHLSTRRDNKEEVAAAMSKWLRE